MTRRSILASAIVIASVATVATAPEGRAAPKLPDATSDQSWIALTGPVGSVTGKGFTLDYGARPVTVVLGNPGGPDVPQDLRQGEEVTVYGKAGAGLFAQRRFVASSIYVYDRSTYHFVGVGDESDDTGYLHVPSYTMTPRDFSGGTFVTVSGRVSAIDGREFTLDAGTQSIAVDTAGLRYDPLDAEGYQQIETGDSVTVTGDVDSGLFADRQLVAHAIVSVFAEHPDLSSGRDERPEEAAIGPDRGAAVR